VDEINWARSIQQFIGNIISDALQSLSLSGNIQVTTVKLNDDPAYALAFAFANRNALNLQGRAVSR